MRVIFLILTLFLVSCAESSSTEQNLKETAIWPKKVTGEVVIADLIADDTGIIWATGWIEVAESSDKVGIQFEGPVLQTIDLNQELSGLYSVWLGPPNSVEFQVERIEKVEN